MDLVSLLKLVIKKLEKLEIPYMLTGGLAVSFWGLPRTTHDIDIIIKAKREDKDKIVNIFKKDFYISEEAVSQAIEQSFTFNIIHYKAGLKIDFWLTKKDPFGILEFQRKQKKKIFGKEIFIISPEDLILEKLLWYKKGESPRHLEDIAGIIEISKPDINYIKVWAIQESTIEIFEEILRNRSLNSL